MNISDLEAQFEAHRDLPPETQVLLFATAFVVAIVVIIVREPQLREWLKEWFKK
jgi:hypothetical protein